MGAVTWKGALKCFLILLNAPRHKKVKRNLYFQKGNLEERARTNTRIPLVSRGNATVPGSPCLGQYLLQVLQFRPRRKTPAQPSHAGLGLLLPEQVLWAEAIPCHCWDQDPGSPTTSPPQAARLPEGHPDRVTSTIIFTVGSVVAMFCGCGGRTVMGTQPTYRQP